MSQTSTIENAGSCIATAQAISAPGRVRWMMRTPSALASDTGWRFYADEDDEDNVAHTTNMRVVDVATVVRMEPLVAAVLDRPVGSDFEIVTLPDGARQVRDTASGAVVAGSGASAPAGPGGVGHDGADGGQVPDEETLLGEPAQGGAEGPRHGDAPGSGWTAAASAVPAEEGLAVAASSTWLRPAVQAWTAARSGPARSALLSEFFGATVFVPLREDGPASFTHEGSTVIPVHTSREGALAWHQRLGLPGEPRLTARLGDEVLHTAFDDGAAGSVVIDPVEVGVEIRSDDPFLVGFSRNGRLKSLVRSGERRAVLDYLTSEGAYGVYLYRALPGQQAYPQLVNRQGGGEREFALFSSALEVFRFQADGSAAEVRLDWVRANLAEDMYLCIDPGADGGFLEFSPAELAGFRTA